MEKRELIKQYNSNLSDLRKIINSFDLIPNAPSDEFDSLNHKLLRQLDKDVDREMISKILKSELTVINGLFENEFDILTIVNTIIYWWKSKNN